MAVIQISKIQVRRGLKSQTGAVPQLSSAEFAWAVDSQELFIGNGSIAEGAPEVGNTKILTEHDNILELADSYRFGSDDLSITESLERSIQNKLDEYVSVLDFGAVPDGSTDCTEAFHSAFLDLFKNPDERYKKTLMVPNGTYLFTSDLRIPTTARIKGETREQSILLIGSNNVVFTTSTDKVFGESGYISSDSPKNIFLSDLSIERTTGSVSIDGVSSSQFKNIKFIGNYTFGQTITSLSSTTASVSWSNVDFANRVTEVEFKDCLFTETGLAIKTIQSTTFKSSIEFINCDFLVCDTGIYIDGTSEQDTDWKILDCNFDQIYTQAFYSTYGYGTKVLRSTFRNCGNQSSIGTTPKFPIINFGESIGNIVKDCSFDRHQNSAVLESIVPTESIPEVYNASKVSILDQNYTSNIFPKEDLTPFIVFSALNRYTVIDYLLVLGGPTETKYSRIGQLTIVRGDDLAGSIEGSSYFSLTDNFTYSPESPYTPGGSIMTDFEFGVEAIDVANTDPNRFNDSGIDTIVLSYRNSGGPTGILTYNISYGV